MLPRFFSLLSGLLGPADSGTRRPPCQSQNGRQPTSTPHGRNTQTMETNHPHRHTLPQCYHKEGILEWIQLFYSTAGSPRHGQRLMKHYTRKNTKLTVHLANNGSRKLLESSGNMYKQSGRTEMMTNTDVHPNNKRQLNTKDSVHKSEQCIGKPTRSQPNFDSIYSTYP